MPGMMSPLRPCHSMVQPPAWFPMSSALFPATKILGVRLRERQEAAVVLQQDERRAHGAAREGAVRRATRRLP